MAGLQASRLLLALGLFLTPAWALQREAFVRIAPRLFDPKTRSCLSQKKALPEEGAMVVFCPPYAFYFRRGRDGASHLDEFGVDGEGTR